MDYTVLIDNHHGIYIPQQFYFMYVANKELFTLPDNVSESDMQILNNPDDENYWEVWNDITTQETRVKLDGNFYTIELGECGDVFAHLIHYHNGIELYHSDIVNMREWVNDCRWEDIEDEEDIDLLSDQTIIDGIEKYYEGGISQFMDDSTPIVINKHYLQ